MSNSLTSTAKIYSSSLIDNDNNNNNNNNSNNNDNNNEKKNVSKFKSHYLRSTSTPHYSYDVNTDDFKSLSIDDPLMDMNESNHDLFSEIFINKVINYSKTIPPKKKP
jgi:hypothetical protein